MSYEQVFKFTMFQSFFRDLGYENVTQLESQIACTVGWLNMSRGKGRKSYVRLKKFITILSIICVIEPQRNYDTLSVWWDCLESGVLNSN